MNLLLFQRKSRRDGYEDYEIHELDFELNRQYDRIRAVKMSLPLLCLPWTVTHRIDRYSPLYRLSVEDMTERRMEIVCVIDGIDEASSDNFQVWWSYCPQEIVWNYQFEPMVKAVSLADTLAKKRFNLFDHFFPSSTDLKEALEIDYDRISLVTPCPLAEPMPTDANHDSKDNDNNNDYHTNKKSKFTNSSHFESDVLLSEE
ncbi:hypothetical protein RFI_22567 [Reticulomyxa filosa]|uniref:Inward rectifier potassium channel C-terminal domain-containing protein n=1 Tax=Reticulomyxa filosa TaxID=46433 RepID=X6MMD0_RETFI|nr:hypothetical protein RFI_22567 [Reticulomyxa filosa]|eukprot:ETO14801.1 hypothetical protein RFI_22567 [Reticulomyxa filosa]